MNYELSGPENAFANMSITYTLMDKMREYYSEVRIDIQDGTIDQYFGYAVAINDTRVAVISWSRYGNESNLYTYNLYGEDEQKIPLDFSGSTSYGHSLQMTDDKILIGGCLSNAASAYTPIYVCDLDGSNFYYIEPAFPVKSFGCSMATNGQKVIVGAHTANSGNVSGAGIAFIFDIDGSNEIQIDPTSPVSSGSFGSSVAINDSKVAVGSKYGGSSNQGVAYLFDLNGNNGKMFRPDILINNANFGSSIDMNNSKIIVGAGGTGAAGTYSGGAYLFDLDGNNEIEIIASDSETYEYFGGNSVSIIDDTVAIGAPSSGYSEKSGSVYLYDLNGNNERKVKPSGSLIDDRFGISVDLYKNLMIVGTYNRFATEGCAYLFNIDKIV